ncbi:unnamed protein product, partial [Dovyalis caffra]
EVNNKDEANGGTCRNEKDEANDSEFRQDSFNGDLRDVKFAWNKLCFGPTFEKLKLAVFSKTWPIGAGPGGMERHASTIYHALAARDHEIHVFTVPSDRKPHLDIHERNLHVYFAANDHGSVNCSLAFEIFNKINANGEFDYVHPESVSLPHWRAKMVPNVAVTWHGIWYEIMHSNNLKSYLQIKMGLCQALAPMTELQEAMPRLIEEIRFFSFDKQHICISNSAGEALVNVYQLPKRNVHVILNGVDHTKFVHDPEAGARFRRRYGLPDNGSLACGRIRPLGKKPVLTLNYPSIVGTAVVKEEFGYTFSPNVKSFVDALELTIRDGPKVMQKRGMACKEYALTMYTATKMASSYERPFSRDC